MAAAKNSGHRMGFGDQRGFTTPGRTFIPEGFPGDPSATSKHLLYRKIQFFTGHGIFLLVSLAEP